MSRSDPRGYDVVLVCCNGEAYLDGQIATILNQTVAPARLLLSDDASSDDTALILERWRRQAPGQVLVRREPERCGVVAHVDRALAALMATGPTPYLFLSDQDDLWDLDKAERSLAKMAALEASWGSAVPLLVHTDLRLIDASGRLLARSYIQHACLRLKRTSLRELAFQNVVTGCTVLINRACLEAALPIPPEAVLHDGWLALVATSLGAVYFLPEPTVSYRQHGDNQVGGEVFRSERWAAWIRSLRDGTAADRAIRPAVEQALALVERYGAAQPKLARDLPPEHLRALLDSTTLRRLRAALALGVRKHGWRRSLAWWISLLWPRRRQRPQRSAQFKPYRLKPSPPDPTDAGTPARRRVLHAIANVQTGGSTRLVVDLIEALGGRLEQRVLTSYLPDPPEYEGLPVEEQSSSATQHAITTAVRRAAPDLIHIHYWGGCDLAWYRKVFRAAEGLGVPVIQNVNTPVAPFICRTIVANVFVSAFVRQTFAPSDLLARVIHPGSDFALFEPPSANQEMQTGLRQSLFGPEPAPVVGMVYRLEPDKLSAGAIDVFLAIVRQRPNCRCLIVGGGSLLEPFQQRVRQEGLEHAFRFTGYVAYERLPALYSLMDLFLAPVWSESFGQVSPFAMAMGVPVLGYEVGGLPEILAEPELLAPPGDDEALAAIAVDFLDRPEHRRQVAERLRQRALQLFSVEAMVAAYAELYQELLVAG